MLSSEDNENLDYDFHVPRLPRIVEKLTADRFMERLRKQWPKGNSDIPSQNLIALVEDALRAYPSSSQLWCILGWLVELGAQPRFHAESAMKCFEKALEHDPLCADAYEGIGSLLNLQSDSNTARFLQVAIDCNSSVDAYLVLAEYHEYAGSTDKASVVLDDCLSQFTEITQTIRAARRRLVKQMEEGNQNGGRGR